MEQRSPPHRAPLDKERAFARIFRQSTFDIVRRWLKRLGVPARERDDAVQEVLFAAYRSFATYDPSRGPPERWLNRIAVHIAAHGRERTQRALRRGAARPLRSGAAEPDPGPEERLAAEEERRAALQAIASLDEALRSVLVAHDLDEVPMAEIAARQGVPLSTVYKRRARAIAAVLAVLAAQAARAEGG